MRDETGAVAGVFCAGIETTERVRTQMSKRRWKQHGQAYMDRLLAHAQRGELNPAYLATHRLSLEDGPRGYAMFKHKQDGCVRAVFAP